MRQEWNKYLKWLLPVIFITYYGCISSFIHVHIVHGTTIVHSHPFGKTDDGAPHRHASFYEIQLFHLLTTLSVEDGAVHAFHLDFSATQIAELVENPVYPDHSQPHKGQLFLRAPPLL